MQMNPKNKLCITNPTPASYFRKIPFPQATVFSQKSGRVDMILKNQYQIKLKTLAFYIQPQVFVVEFEHGSFVSFLCIDVKKTKEEICKIKTESILMT